MVKQRSKKHELSNGHLVPSTESDTTESDKGTREKLETQAGARGIAEGWRNARYSGGLAESSGWLRRRKRLFRACRDTPRSPAATP